MTIAITLLAVLAFLLLAVIAGLLLELRRSSGIYEQLYQVVLSDRDAARAEVIELRKLHFPMLRAIEKQPATAAAQPAADPLDSMMRRRMPTRLKLKFLSQMTNTKQKGRDEHAAAIKSTQENKSA